MNYRPNYTIKKKEGFRKTNGDQKEYDIEAAFSVDR
jgi:hypothetical protein